MFDIKIRLKQLQDTTVVRMLISHPMETGRRVDKDRGERIPSHFINKLIVRHQKRVIVSCNLGPGISMNPYFSFRFKNGKTGDSVTITWTDNQGYSGSASAKIR